jgi:CheY-like chemotaxis protein
MILEKICKPIELLESLRANRASGVLYLEADISGKLKKRSRILVWKNGQIVYGGLKLPEPLDFIKILQQKLNREWADSAISFAKRLEKDNQSIRTLLERLVEMKIFTWEQIATSVHSQILLVLEQMLPYTTRFQFDSHTELDLGCSWELPELMLDVARRQDRWSALSPSIPSMEAVPQIKSKALPTVKSANVQKHLMEWVDGKRSLVEIAAGIDKDPLELAQSYFRWVRVGWLVMHDGNSSQEKVDLPTVLAVDDSAVMQQLIGQALAGRYRVLAANNAVDALSLIYHEKISLLLLDVSMPGIDGLELCRTVRNLSQFRNLPIVMLTSRDKFFDKVKGRLVGATEYLTKPFDAEQLRQVVGQYTKVNAIPGAENSDRQSSIVLGAT